MAWYDKLAETPFISTYDLMHIHPEIVGKFLFNSGDWRQDFKRDGYVNLRHPDNAEKKAE